MRKLIYESLEEYKFSSQRINAYLASSSKEKERIDKKEET